MQFQLRSTYAAGWRGGTISYQGGTYNIGTALTAGGGTITTTDPTLIDMLDGVPALQRVGAPDPPGTPADYYGPINVDVPSDVADGDVPAWDSIAKRWVARAPTGGTGGTGGGATLTWDADTSNYVPAELRTDTSAPRLFIGTADPSLIAGITLADYDSWRQA